MILLGKMFSKNVLFSNGLNWDTFLQTITINLYKHKYM